MNLRRSINSVGNGPFDDEAGPSQDREILSQAAFLRVISIERRRTERSRKPFLLMLLDMGDHMSVRPRVEDLNTLLDALSVSTRETDVAGWYEGDRVIGVMFTEISLEERGTIVSTMISQTQRHPAQASEPGALQPGRAFPSTYFRKTGNRIRANPATRSSIQICPNEPIGECREP